MNHENNMLSYDQHSGIYSIKNLFNHIQLSGVLT